MKLYIARGIMLTFITFCLFLRITGQPFIGTFPPQVHQQICQESTYTRYLDVFNYGKSVLSWNAEFTPGPYDWVTASPLSGEIEPGDTVQIAFVFNSTGLALDNYYAYLQINSNDPIHPDTTILAMLHVQQITVFIEPENDSICAGCNTTLHTMAFGCSEEYQFEWTSDPPGFTSTEKSPVVAPNVNTTYTVHVTDGGGTAEKSVFIQVYGTSAIDENQNLSRNAVYPNPGHDRFILQLDSKYGGKGNLKISNIHGGLIYAGEIEIYKGFSEYIIHPGYLDPGIYFLSVEQVIDANRSIVFKDKIIVK